MADARQEFGRLIQPVLSTLKIGLSPLQISQLAAHFALLQQWNRRINLTGLREATEIVERHFGESLFTGLRIPESARSLVDVGSGGGFPGLPIAVLRPRLDVTLVESVAKKAAFLREVSRDLDNVQVYHGRFETLQKSFAGSWDSMGPWHSIPPSRTVHRGSCSMCRGCPRLVGRRLSASREGFGAPISGSWTKALLVLEGWLPSQQDMVTSREGAELRDPSS